MDWIHLTQKRGLVMGSCEHGNVPLSSIEGGVFLEFLFKKDSASWSWLMIM